MRARCIHKFCTWRAAAHARIERGGMHVAAIRRRALHPRGFRSERAWRARYLLAAGFAAFAASHGAAQRHHTTRLCRACLQVWACLTQQSKYEQLLRKQMLCKRYVPFHVLLAT